MPTKRQLRSSKKLSKIRKQRKKFPELLKNLVETSDIILEVLDARFIEETRNEEIEKLIHDSGKQILYVLNKADLRKKVEVKKFLSENLRPFSFVSALKRMGSKDLRNKIKALSKKVETKEDKIFVGVIGYPNTGKSSLINLLIGKSSAKIGATAGFTKGLQKLKLSRDIVLIDSPGVIPNKEYSSIDSDKISKHVMVGARDYHKVRDPEIVVSRMMDKYSEAFENFYKLKVNDAEELIEILGKKRNILKKGGVINTDRVARLIIKDWQDGKIII